MRPDYQLVGVFSDELTTPFAEILKQLGRKAAWAVHGTTGDGRGMDELSTLAESQTTQLSPDGSLSDVVIDPTELGFAKPELADLQGGDAVENAAILTAILDGSERGAKRDIVVLNSAAGLVVSGLAEDLPAGIARAAEAIDSGAALEKLRALQS